MNTEHTSLRENGINCVEMPRSLDTWYLKTVNKAAPYPPLDGDKRADVAVLGAGYTGLSTALHLAERGCKVVVIEAKRVGWGASGRNGGQLIAGYNRSIATLGRWIGPGDARLLWELAIEAKCLVADLVTRYRIACGLTPGHMFVALNGRQKRDLEAMEREWRSLGYDGALLLDRVQLHGRIGSESYVGGLYDPAGGHLHPLNYALGLAEACRGLGVDIHEETPVVAMDRGACPSFTTTRGTIRADRLVIAGNALLGGLVPGLKRMIAPIDTWIATTEPMERARILEVLRDDVAICDMNQIVTYFRRTPDDRLLFGTGAGIPGRDPADLEATMRKSMLGIFPGLADLRFDHVWGGLIDMTANRLPHIGRLGRACYFAQGFSGQGVALTAIAGRVIAEAIAGRAERLDLFARIPHRPLPAPPLLAPALALALLWYRFRDSL